MALRNCTWFDWGVFSFCTLRIRSMRRGFEYMGKKSSFVFSWFVIHRGRCFLRGGNVRSFGFLSISILLKHVI